jgi:hypothetical protein
MALVHKASKNNTPKSTEARIAAIDSAALPQMPLTVEVSAKMIDQPFICHP